MLQRLFRQALRFDAELARAYEEEMLREQGHVLGALAQAGEPQADHIQAVIEVLAERALAHPLLKILVGRGNDSHIRLELLMAADPVEGAVGQDSQQPRL